ncbi:MAG: cobalamin-binding protein [Clostridiales bacterium]|nr:cobalamin-binding protein [Clostridiales bacterium]
MGISKSETFGMMKTLLDAHTMGVHASAALLRDCGYRVLISPPQIEDALDKIEAESSQKLIINWIKENNISKIGVSYRLDPDTAVEIIGRLVTALKRERLYETSSAIVKSIHFAGLTPACEKIDKEYNGRIRTFRGGESAEETLLVMGVPEDEIPAQITEGCKYDKELLKFGAEIIKKNDYKKMKPLERVRYSEYGTFKDTLELRLDHNFEGEFQPLIRAHSGPFSADMTREQCLKEYNDWCRDLAEAGFLDVLSIGSSQLSQSNFGENWEGRPNGGGVPVNSEQEYRNIWEAAKPMLVRTYSGTKNVEAMADMYERTINIAWHALSLWWFNELDGRGPNSLYQNLKEHISAIKYITKIGKPVETNVPHHFAFRGCDDVTYIVSAYLAAKMCKKCGVKTFVLQNMLNTPRSTWGIQDLAKSRTMIKLVKELQDDNFRVILQTRAGLDYFKPDLQEAKVQLAAVTAMMDDIDPDNIYSPEIIHVVSYCEALFLATPDILNDSIKITRTALQEYRERKKKGLTSNVMTDDICSRAYELESAARKIIKAMEENIADLYSPEGLYIAFTAGWLPVPELWSDSDEFLHAKRWETKMSNGGIKLIDHGILLTTDTRINRCISYIPDAEYTLKNKYLKLRKV